MQNLTIDGGAEGGSLLALAKAFGTVSGDQIIGHALPVYDFRTAGGAAVLGLERELAEPTLAIFRGIDPTTVSAPPVPVVYQVLNGSRTAGQAGEAATALSARRMNVENIDNGPTTERTTVRYPSTMAGGAETLGDLLVVEPLFEIDETLTQVVLLTGTDYQGVLDTPRERRAPDGPDHGRSRAPSPPPRPRPSVWFPARRPRAPPAADPNAGRSVARARGQSEAMSRAATAAGSPSSGTKRNSGSSGAS